MANVNITASADYSKILAEQNKQLTRQDELIQKLRATTSETRRADQAAGGWADSMMKVAGAIAPVVTLGGAISAVGRTLREIDQDAKNAAASIAGMVAATKALTQISGSPEELAQFKALSDRIAVGQGMTVEAARGLVFQAVSSGFSPQEIDRLAKVSRFTSEPGRAFAAAKIAQLQFGAAETGSAEAILAKQIVAARAGATTFDDFGELLSKVAPSARMIGATDEETMAALSVMTLSGIPSEQASRMSAALAFLQKDSQYANRGVLENLQALKTRFAPGGVLNTAELSSYVKGDREAAAGLNVMIQNRGAIADLAARIDAENALVGTPGSALTKTIDIAGGDPELSVTLRAVAENSRLSISERRAGLEEAAQQSILNRYRAFRRDIGKDGLMMRMVDAPSLWMSDLLQDPGGSALTVGFNARNLLPNGIAAPGAADTPRYEEFRRDLKLILDEFRRSVDALESLGGRASGVTAALEIGRGE